MFSVTFHDKRRQALTHPQSTNTRKTYKISSTTHAIAQASYSYFCLWAMSVANEVLQYIEKRCFFLTLFMLNTVLLLSCNYSYKPFKSGIALNYTQFTKCYFSTLNKFQIPLLIISMDPVTRVNRFLSPKRSMTAGDKVRVHAHLITKLRTITM